MIRRLLRVAPVIMLVILIVGCNAKTVSTEKEISDVITKDLGADIEVQIIDTVHLEGKLLVFYMTSDEYQAHEYGYAEFDEKNSEYKFLRTYAMYDRGIDLRSAPYKNAYLFVVNNADCNYIQVVQNGNEYIVEVEEIPFVYFWGDVGNMEYNFLDKGGNPLYP